MHFNIGKSKIKGKFSFFSSVKDSSSPHNACRYFSVLPFQSTPCIFFRETRRMARNNDSSRQRWNSVDAQGFTSSSLRSSLCRPGSFFPQTGLSSSSSTTVPTTIATVEFTDGGSSSLPPLPSAASFPSFMGGSEAGEEEAMSIPRDSALYSSYSARYQLDSRSRWNTWELTRHKNQDRTNVWKKGVPLPASSSSSLRVDTSAAYGLATKEHLQRDRQEAWEKEPAPGEHHELDDEGVIAFTDERRLHRTHEASYSDELMNETLMDSPSSKGESRSTYGLRKIPLPGVFMYQEIVSQEEEIKINEELLKVLQDPRAAYITTETRYCVHLYERELGIPDYDTLAFDMRTASPTLKRVLHRLFYLGLIPSLPNICQVSEMIGNFAGYPLHEKPQAIGSYYGLLNLVSPTVLHMQHKACPWFPRLYLSPRSVTVVSDPSLSDFKIGYKQAHQPFHEFEYHTRISKDYRIEVLFATAEVEHLKLLNESILLTDYAEKHLSHRTTATPPSRPLSNRSDDQGERRLPSSPLSRSFHEDNTPIASTDAWIKKLREDLQLDERSGVSTKAAVKGGISSGRPETEQEEHSMAVPLDGHLLREEALRLRLVGKPRPSLDFGESEEGRVEGNTMGCADLSGATASRPLSPISPARQRIEALMARHQVASRRIPRKGRGKTGLHGEGTPEGDITRVTREGKGSLTPRVIPVAPLRCP